MPSSWTTGNTTFSCQPAAAERTLCIQELLSCHTHNTTTDLHNKRTYTTPSLQDVSYGQDHHPNTLPTGFTSPNNSEYLTLAQPSHLKARRPGTRGPILRINTSVPPMLFYTNLPQQQRAAEGPEATCAQVSQPVGARAPLYSNMWECSSRVKSEGAKLRPFTQNLTLGPASTKAPQQQMAFGGKGDTYMQMSPPVGDRASLYLKAES